MTRLKVLNLSGSIITSIDTLPLTILEKLFINFTKVSHINTLSLTRLKVLGIDKT